MRRNQALRPEQPGPMAQSKTKTKPKSSPRASGAAAAQPGAKKVAKKVAKPVQAAHKSAAKTRAKSSAQTATQNGSALEPPGRPQTRGQMKLFPYGHATHPQWRMAAGLVLAQVRAQMGLADYASEPKTGVAVTSPTITPRRLRPSLDHLRQELPSGDRLGGHRGHWGCRQQRRIF